MFSCTQCDYTTLLKSNLKCHTKRHSNTPLTPNLPPKIAHRKPIPNIIEPPGNDHLFEQLEHEEIQSMLEQNTQVGFGVTPISSTDENIPHEILHFLEMNGLGAQTKLLDKFMSKIFNIFMIQKPSTVDPKLILDTSITPIPHSLKPLPMPLRISFADKPTLSKSIRLLETCRREIIKNPRMKDPRIKTNHGINRPF